MIVRSWVALPFDTFADRVAERGLDIFFVK